MNKIILIPLMVVSSLAYSSPPANFASAKAQAKTLWTEIGRTSFYCDCAYRDVTEEERAVKRNLGSLRIIPESCNYASKNPLSRSGNLRAQTLRIEGEHVVPADWIATGFGCQDQTRSECRNIPGYDAAEGDLFNLVPAVGELNLDRSARLFGVIPAEDRDYGACDFEVDKSGEGESHLRGMAEPMPSIRGDIARVWFYMADQYGVVIPDDNLVLLKQWADEDPVDDTELTRHDVISASMGWTNKFVEAGRLEVESDH